MSTIEIESPRESTSTLSLTSRQRWIDLFFVVGICLWRPLFSSTYIAIYGPHSHSDASVFFGIMDELSGLAVLFYVLYRRNAGLGYWGHQPERVDVLRGILLKMAQGIAAVSVGYVYVYSYYFVAGHYPLQLSGVKILGMHLSLAWLAYSLINPWVEELIFRGFLMTELSALISVPVAVVASTLLQTSYHLYQGTENALMLGCIFLIASIYYARTRRLLPVILAHMIADLLPLARVALFR